MPAFRLFPIVIAFLVVILPSCQPSAGEKEVLAANLKDSTTIASKSSSEALPDTIATVVFDSTNYEFKDGAIEISWKFLSQVVFTEEYNEEVLAYIPYPTFDPLIQAIDGKEILIKGYIIPFEETGDESILILSANPFSTCFFCGGAGPETVMDIKVSKKIKNPKTDQVATFRGKLRLNSTDLYYLNYILEDAKLVKGD